MRIFYASDTTPNPLFQSDLWRNNLYLPLVDLGHDVVEFEYDLRETFKNVFFEDPVQRIFIDQNRPQVTEALLKQIKAAHAVKPVDLFFSYFYDVCVLPEAIDEIRTMGIKTVNWYCNGSYQLHLASQISPHYDWCLVPEKFRLKDYVEMGAAPIYCQEAANPNVYKPYDVPLEFDVTFIGQAYGERPAYIQYLLDQGIDVRVWGSGWQAFAQDRLRGIENTHTINQPGPLQRAAYVGRKLLTPEGWRAVARRLTQTVNAGSAMPLQPNGAAAAIALPSSTLGGVLSDLAMVQMYSRSKINLGFSTCGNTHQSEERIVQIRLRDFEVPMSGGFYMVEYMEELEEFFEIGKEIVCYTDPQDLTEKIKYYLRNDSERETIRRAGHERCLRDHTWHARFEMAFKEMRL